MMCAWTRASVFRACQHGLTPVVGGSNRGAGARSHPSPTRPIHLAVKLPPQASGIACCLSLKSFGPDQIRRAATGRASSRLWSSSRRTRAASCCRTAPAPGRPAPIRSAPAQSVVEPFRSRRRPSLALPPLHLGRRTRVRRLRACRRPPPTRLGRRPARAAGDRPSGYIADSGPVYEPPEPNATG
jgi:hypothetical protein